MGITRTQTASHWGVYTVDTDEQGRVTGTAPLQRDPHPSAIAAALPELVRSTLRIDQPYVREGFLKRRRQSSEGRGGERFIGVSWNEAMALVADELRRVKENYGNEAIYGGSYGWASAGRLHHAPSVLKRFLGLFGGYVDKVGNHSFGAAMHIMPYVVGRSDITSQVMPWPHIIAATRLIVLFGGAHLKNTQINSGGSVLHESIDWFGKARKAGIEFVNISPSRQDATASLRADWLALRPNTDMAVMLGLAHTLASEGLHDRAFLRDYCVGYEAFERYLLGAADGVPKDAHWACAISGVDAEAIRSLARRMAATRTLVVTSWSVQRAEHGEQPIWMTVTLACMLGQIGLPGGGFGFGLAAESEIAMPRPGGIPRPTLSLGPNPVKTRAPVGRIAEMLLNPGASLDYNGKTICFPDIKLIYSVGGNPFHHNANLNRFVKAWRRPETIIVHEPWWSPPAKFADIVLPATTTMERNDIQTSELSRFYIAMHKVIDPVGRSRNDFDIFAELADRFGLGAAFHENRNEMGWLAHMYEEARQIALTRGYGPPDFEAFWEAGLFEFPLPATPEVFLESYRRDPNGAPLKTASGKIEIFSQTIDRYGYDDCPPHPTWLEPSEWLGGPSAARFPFHLLSNQPGVRLHSQLDCSSLSRGSKMNGREAIAVSREDAEARGFRTGDAVRVFNDRGAFVACVRVADHLRRGVAQIATGAWYDPLCRGVPGSLEKHGNPNVVTNDGGSSRLSQSPAAQTVLVDIEPYPDPPAPTAFDTPVCIRSDP